MLIPVTNLQSGEDTLQDACVQAGCVSQGTKQHSRGIIATGAMGKRMPGPLFSHHSVGLHTGMLGLQGLSRGLLREHCGGL